MLGIIKKIFKLKTKSEKDIEQILPIVNEINEIYNSLSSLSNDQLRQKTLEFKQKIKNYIADEENQINQIKQQLEQNPDIDVNEKEKLFKQIEDLDKKIVEKIEEVLEDILPEAFAVLKETARRFSENEVIEVTATEFDKQLASEEKDFVSVENNKAIWRTTWNVMGHPIKWNMVHYDVQLIGGIALHRGKIAEMATGEGKTLVSTLPIYLNALAGRGVHLVTVNNYLARRDCQWNGPLFQFHGLSVDCIDNYEPHSAERRNAYLCDITYGTNNEFGFDYLRDNMVTSPDEMVQRGHHYAIVDEVDSVLIDDARTPLIISGPTPKGDKHEFNEYKPYVEKLVNAQKQYVQTCLVEAKKYFAEGKEKEAGVPLLRAYRGLPKNNALIKFLSEPGVKTLLQKTENYYMQDQMKEMHKIDQELYFVIDEKNHHVELTDKGIDFLSTLVNDSKFFVIPNVGEEIAELEKQPLSPKEKAQKKESILQDFSLKSERIHTVNQLLKAYTLFERDVEYVIDNGQVKIVDEQTGRIMEGRRYSDGLHQAIEAKENVKVEAATQTYATITLQNYFRMYHKLAGMTGTAETEAQEFWDIYKLDVMVIPTHRPVIRKDYEDLVYRTKREKYNAVIEEIVKLVNAGRPVLVGTTSVENSEILSRMLKMKGIKHNVLNAKHHQKEAEIVAEAGKAGTVTIATNMAGRGTDIKLGPGVKEAGGLAIIGTERHESRRVDRQLRGRAGRQGDPGSSQFFVSLEDDLMRLFGSERIAALIDRMGGLEEGEPIQHSMLSRSIERAQKKVEENNFGIRKRLIEYDDVMNAQREVIYSRRRNALFGDKLSIDIANMFYDTIENLVTTYHPLKNYEELSLDFIRLFAMELPITEAEFSQMNMQAVTEKLFNTVYNYYTQKKNEIAHQIYPFIQSVYNNPDNKFENILFPFTDKIKTLHVVSNLKKAYETQGKDVLLTLEKMTVLSMIDEAWKEHLRELDDLKQSVHNAVYEQKDPLVIYKIESFNLFKQMIDNTNKEIVSFLIKAHLPVEEQTQEVKQAQFVNQVPQQRKERLVESRTTNENGTPTQQKPKQQPVKVGEKIRPNDPCPCGSGKKYKKCHGAGL
ncbi:MAG TPA: preprotein translocase subunit SecA [Bacteroidia bacterium]|nr:preprotein translocase subunit SecA [Bacteroidia bacterium]